MSTANNSTDQNVTTTSKTITSKTIEWFVPRVDLVFVLAFLSVLPLLWLYAQDIWLRSNAKYALGVIAIPLVFGMIRCRLCPQAWKERSKWSLFCLLLAAVSATAGAILLSPWLGVLALICILGAWMIERCGNVSWFEAIGLTIPLGILLVLPLNDAIDLLAVIRFFVGQSVSNLLDLSGVPHIANADFIELKRGLVPVGKVLEGMASPYLLMAMALFLCLVMRPSLLVCLLTIVSVIAWSWFGATLHLYVGILLLERADANVFSSFRHIGMQVTVLLIELVLLWMQIIGVKKLFTPFETYSEGTDNAHRLFNTIVLWPVKDPLRKSRDPSSVATPTGNLRSNRAYLYTMLFLGVVFVAASGVAFWRISSSIGFDGIARQTHASMNAMRGLGEQLLPDSDSGLTLVATEPLSTHMATAKVEVASWTYSLGNVRYKFELVGPYRGFYPAELDFRARGFKVKAESEEFVPKVDAADAESTIPSNVVFRDFKASDVYGESYIAYASVLAPPVKMPQSTTSNVSELLSLQPSTLNLCLSFEGAEGLRDTDREFIHQLLLVATKRLQGQLQSAAGGQ